MLPLTLYSPCAEGGRPFVVLLEEAKVVEAIEEEGSEACFAVTLLLVLFLSRLAPFSEPLRRETGGAPAPLLVLLLRLPNMVAV